MIRPLKALALTCALAATTAAGAQSLSDTMVAATDAPGLVKTLQDAGYDAEISRPAEAGAGAILDVTVDGESIAVLVSDCDEAVVGFCETLILSAWWDRETPVSDEIVAAANQRHKYVSVYRDSEGDPTMQWAILTRSDGVPASVFIDALERFAGIANEFTPYAFEGEAESEEEGEERAEDNSEEQ